MYKIEVGSSSSAPIGAKAKAAAIASFVLSEPRDRYDMIVRAALFATIAAGRIENTASDQQLRDDASDACVAANRALRILGARRSYAFISDDEPFVFPPALTFNRHPQAHMAEAKVLIDEAIELLASHHKHHPELKLADLVGVSFETHDDSQGIIVLMSVLEELWYGMFEDANSDVLH